MLRCRFTRFVSLLSRDETARGIDHDLVGTDLQRWRIGLTVKEDSMKLYYSPGACSLSPHIVATEAGLAVEAVEVNLAEHKTESGEDYMKINPKGDVRPASRRWERSHRGPGNRSVPGGSESFERTRPKGRKYRALSAPGVAQLYRHRTAQDFGPLFNKASSDDAKNTAKTNINKRLTYINDQLANRQYLMGSNLRRRRLCLHHYKLDELRRDRSQALSECRSLPGSHCRTPEGARFTPQGRGLAK